MVSDVQWYDEPSIRRWSEHRQGAFGEPTSPQAAAFDPQWLTDQLNAAFEKGRQIERGSISSALNLLHSDSHQWSTRPCSTCKAISAVFGEPFGCIRYAKDRAARRPA